MDPQIALKVLEYGAIGLFCVYLWRELKAARAEAQQVAKDAQAAAAAAQARCDADRQALVGDLRSLESWCRSEMVPVVRDCGIALRETQETIRASNAIIARAVDVLDPSGRHPELPQQNDGRGDG